MDIQPTITVVLGTCSLLKIEAVNRAFARCFPYSQVVVVPLDATSGINEQPFGNTETIQGAQNRISSAKALFSQAYDYVVAIENGITEIPLPLRQREDELLQPKCLLLDLSWVVIESRKNNLEAYATSTGLPFDEESFNVTRQKGFDKFTVGDTIANKLLQTRATGCSSKDPHSYLTNQQLSRLDMMEQAVRCAIGQLQVKDGQA
jgi:non-canonical (house-cleaning) NTP pyrophosphatase